MHVIKPPPPNLLSCLRGHELLNLLALHNTFCFTSLHVHVTSDIDTNVPSSLAVVWGAWIPDIFANVISVCIESLLLFVGLPKKPAFAVAFTKYQRSNVNHYYTCTPKLMKKLQG